MSVLFCALFCLFHGKADFALGICADGFDTHLLSLCHKVPDLVDIAPGNFRDMHHSHDLIAVRVRDLHKSPVLGDILDCSLINFSDLDLHITPYPFLFPLRTAARK